MSTLQGALIEDESGATMAEYALMIALIAVVVIVGAGALGVAISESLFASLAEFLGAGS